MTKKTKMVCGVGTNDADYNVQIFEHLGYVDGKIKQKLIWFCPLYQTWKSMLTRGYSSKYKEKHPTYQDVFVNEEWHLFSNFRNWMQEQKWQDREGKKLHLDKDILVEGNKEYSKDKCVFVPNYINKFLLEGGATRVGEWPMGVCWHKASNKFYAQCNNSGKSRIYLGLFNDPNDAHIAWKTYKHKLALQYALELEAEGYDSRVVQALKMRYM